MPDVPAELVLSLKYLRFLEPPAAQERQSGSRDSVRPLAVCEVAIELVAVTRSARARATPSSGPSPYAARPPHGRPGGPRARRTRRRRARCRSCSSHAGSGRSGSSAEPPSRAASATCAHPPGHCAAGISQAGFDGGLVSRILSSGEETLRGHGTSEEVPR
jgi:hypothetical protein